MTSQKIISSVKNAIGTVFLLAGAFFVCSTLVSIRAVFADPIAPTNVNEIVVPQGTRTNVRTSGRTSPRGTNATTRATVARTAVAPTNNPRANTSANQNRAVQSRAVATRTNARTTNKIANQRADMTKSRNVVNRTKSAINRANANLTRNVRARTASSDMVDNARVSLQGSAIRGSKGTQTTAYSYLNSKLYTGNYSNIIDSSTGLISADAFSNCLESYYTCMDEICTARNAAQRRCACAGRVQAFADAEAQLEAANEELIKASGELALLIANKGKDISDAFRLTDAEKGTHEIERDGQTTGNLQVKGHWVISHYFGKEESALTADGWFDTGDIATLDQDGFMKLSDRSKDLIKSGGEWISSVELENIAMGHPEIAMAAVIAAQHPKWDERPVLIAIKKPDSQLSETDLLEYYADKVAKWQIPDRVVFVDTIPLSGTGKMLKKDLRELYGTILLEQAAG